MLEIPESKTIGLQADAHLAGKTIIDVITASSVHKFAWYNGDPADYHKMLVGKRIESAKGHGMFVDLYCNGNTTITIGDGTNMRYCTADAPYKGKHQLLIVLDDNTYLVFTVAMYGAIYAFQGTFDNKYYTGSINSISPLSDDFNEEFFENIFRSIEKDISVKALLATEQRIPGLGNGVLQDILFNARINPKNKKSTLKDSDKNKLFQSIKTTLKDMADKGGRDTEKNLFGMPGGYKTILSKNTLAQPCPVCGDSIVKEAYLGGAVYYCPPCQQIKTVK